MLHVYIVSLIALEQSHDSEIWVTFLRFFLKNQFKKRKKSHFGIFKKRKNVLSNYDCYTRTISESHTHTHTHTACSGWRSGVVVSTLASINVLIDTRPGNHLDHADK